MEREFLERCITRRLSTRQIAVEAVCSQTNVRYWLRHYGLVTNPLPGIGNGGRGCEAHGRTKCPQCYRGGAHHVTKRRRKLKQMLVDERGGRCEMQDCPVASHYVFDLSDLEFHHRDPATKLRCLANWSRSEAALREEAVKCILVCALCHRRLDRQLRMVKRI